MAVMSIESVPRAIASLSEAKRMLAQASADLVAAFASVKDRGSVVRYARNAFTDSDVNIRECLDPFYYDLPKQAAHVAGLVDQLGSAGARSALESIITRGSYRDKGTLRKFHPEFITQAKPTVLLAIELFESTTTFLARSPEGGPYG